MENSNHSLKNKRAIKQLLDYQYKNIFAYNRT